MIVPRGFISHPQSLSRGEREDKRSHRVITGDLPLQQLGQIAGSFNRSFIKGWDGGMHGFTLLEMMVALVVASIMLTVATLNLMPNAQTVLREESQRLAFLMENGAMSSQAGGQPLAWSGTGNTYRFWKRTKDGVWERIERDNLLHPRILPDAVRIGKVSFDGRSIEPGSLIVLSPELSAKDFRVSLLSNGMVSDIVGNGLGKVDVVAGRTP